jgi:hypothetical protein
VGDQNFGPVQQYHPHRVHRCRLQYVRRITAFDAQRWLMEEYLVAPSMIVLLPDLSNSTQIHCHIVGTGHGYVKRVADRYVILLVVYLMRKTYSPELRFVPTSCLIARIDESQLDTVPTKVIQLLVKLQEPFFFKSLNGPGRVTR